MEAPPRYYLFAPGEILFAVEVTGITRLIKERPRSYRELLSMAEKLLYSSVEISVRELLETRARDYLDYEPAPASSKPVLFFVPPPKDKAELSVFSLAFLKFQKPIDDARLLELVYSLWEMIKEYRGKLPLRSPEHEEIGLHLTAATPNWLLSGAPNEPPGPPDMGGGGGPGTRPVPVSFGTMQRGIAYSDTPWDFEIAQPHNISALRLDTYSRIQTALKARNPNGPPDRDVEVIILDTAPPAAPPDAKLFDTMMSTYGCAGIAPPLSLTEAFDKWADTHPLLKSLLGIRQPNGQITGPQVAADGSLRSDRLKITYYPDYNAHPSDGWTIGSFDEKRTRKVDGDGYPHFVMDHGTFIAGIIHTLAPTARLHLIEVLNAYGYCTFKAIAAGFDTLLREHPIGHSHLIVNMSLMYTLPGDIQELKNLMAELETTDHALAVLLGRLINDRSFAENQVLPTEIFCHLISELSSLIEIFDDQQCIPAAGGAVIAAAGNDGQGGNHPEARYPAAYADTLGVAALKSGSSQLAPYSNRADQPYSEGIAVLGGDENATPGNESWADEQTGILGLYIGDFPNPNGPNIFQNVIPNESGWARWSGTSFATPIVSGLIAQLLISGQARDVKEAIAILRAAFPEAAGAEDRLLVRQG